LPASGGSSSAYIPTRSRTSSPWCRPCPCRRCWGVTTASLYWRWEYTRVQVDRHAFCEGTAIILRRRLGHGTEARPQRWRGPVEVGKNING
jgi:hypothetical protein